jgi:Mrp family chromosome partitioning ATPase/capsular polysaccharide biosynthesis protein
MLDPAGPMDFLTYFRALRRRWWVIVVCVVLGAGVGYASTLLDTEEAKEGRTYYKATTTLVYDTNSNSSSLQPVVTNPDQMAFLVTTGDVPDRVAEELGTSESGRELAEHIVTTTNSITSTLDITAADADSDRAAQLADAFAAQLGASLEQRNKEKFDKEVAELTERIKSTEAQANILRPQLNSGSPDAALVQRQYDATQNNYYQLFSERQELEADGAPSTSITVLENAQSQPIDADEYQTRLDMGALGQNHLRTDFAQDSAPVIAASGSSLNSPAARTVVGGFLGLLVGIGLALFAERLDRRLRTRDEIEEAFGLPVLAEVPKLSRADLADDALVSFTTPMSRVAEAFRAVRTSLAFQQSVSAGAGHASGNGGNGNNGSNGRNGNGATASGDRLFDAGSEPLVVMVTSAAPREGKSTTTANLAVAFAESGASVLVVNCDFRRPTIHRRFAVADEPRRVQDSRVPGVKIVTNVLQDQRANPSQVVAAQRHVIAAARGRFDVILLDTAPLLTANDALEVVGAVDLVLLVAQASLTTRDNAQRVTELLGRVDAAMAGVVLIGTTDASNSEYYYYYQRTPGAKGERDEVGDASATTDLFEGAPDDAIRTEG